MDDTGEQESTIVVGSVRGAPKAVRVTIGGTSSDATIACFEQASWCTYKAEVPTSFRGSVDEVVVDVR